MALKFIVGVDGESRYQIIDQRSILVLGLPGNELSLTNLLYVFNKTQDVTYYMPVEGITLCTVDGGLITINPVFTPIDPRDELIIYLNAPSMWSSILGILNIATMEGTTTLQKEGIGEASSVELQLDWEGVSSPYEVEVIVKTRSQRSMKYVPLDKTMRGFLETEEGSFIFSLWKWTAEDIQLEVKKNTCTSGTITVAINTKK
jgi:hypothetical protein